MFSSSRTDYERLPNSTRKGEKMTITPEQMLLIVPASAVLYCLFRNRAPMWENKKTIFHVLLVIASYASVVVLVTHKKDEWNAENVILAKKQSQEQAERLKEIRETRLAQNRARSEDSEAPTEPVECKDPKQLELPGMWWHLYESLENSTYWEAKLAGIESFAYHFAITDVEPLPMVGFNHILGQLVVEGDTRTSWKYIYRAKAALEPYLSPHNAQPDCFLGAK